MFRNKLTTFLVFEQSSLAKNMYINLPDILLLYALIDYITYGAKFLTNISLIFEFQRFHKESWLMDCNYFCNL